MNRRELLARGCLVAGGALALRWPAADPHSAAPARQALQLRIRHTDALIAPGVGVPTLTCNDLLSGPLVHVDPYQPIDLDVTNESGRTVRIEGAGTDEDLYLAAGGRRRTRLCPATSGVMCPRISAGVTAEGPLGGVLGTFVRTPAADAEQTHFLTIHHWLPSLTPKAGACLRTGVTYRYASLGDRLVGAGEPIRVRKGQHVRFHFFNASPTKSVNLALPGHRFLVTDLDGYAVAQPRLVTQVALGPGERLGAQVHMTSPGRFVLGSIDRRDRDAGFGRIVEYINARGSALHPDIVSPQWDYRVFGSPPPHANDGATPISIQFAPAQGLPLDSHRLRLSAGKRYRLSLVNATGERHCVALRGQSFRLTNVAGSALSGIVKDTLALPTFARTEIEFDSMAAEVALSHASSVAVSHG
jgi:FtsP/CotA-like multicopper oxidase with cupredoxin domain